MKTLPAGLRGLAKYDQWILWRPMLKDNGHVDKLPINPRTMQVGDPHDPKGRVSFKAVAEAEHRFANQFGIGFVFTKDDPFFFIDIDNCATNSNEWNDLAKQILTHFSGAAVTTSSSGVGLHIIGTGKPLSDDHKRKHPAGFEVYCHSRFVALTFNPTVGDCNTPLDVPLNTFLVEYMGREGEGGFGDWTDGPVEGWTGPANDDELISKACAKVSHVAAFGGRATFKQLWDGDPEALGAHFPDPQGVRPFDESSADGALAAHLAFWTGKDCARIERLMRRSGLARDKWDAHGSYLLRTITGACRVQKRIYDFHAEDEGVAGYFPGCTYISELNRILTPEGMLLKSEQFRGKYGGPIFRLDASKNTRNAWTAATESNPPAVQKVDCMRFRPRDEPGLITMEGGLSAINAFKPKFGARIKGDVDPFLAHVRRLIRGNRDANIFLSYLAACVQQVGVKFQWCPVLQGTQGNGKTVFYKVLEYALGTDYCFQLSANDIENKFNGWIQNKLLIVIEELRIRGRITVADILKPLITNDRIGIQQKGVDQITGDNFANFLIFSNHKDAVLKVRDDRRYSVFFTAQQTVDDLRRDKMDAQYFRDLYNWLNNGGYAIVADYLARRPVDCDVLGRAPDTGSTLEAIAESMGTVEQIILEAIDSEEIGFRGGMISLTMASQYLKSQYKAISPRALGNILRDLGYILPPALNDNDGRLKLDNGYKTRVYVKADSVLANIQHREELRAAWDSIK